MGFATRTGTPPFNPTNFFAKAGEGRTFADYRKGKVVFAQGDAADAIFSFGRVSSVLSERTAKKRWWQYSDPANPKNYAR